MLHNRGCHKWRLIPPETPTHLTGDNAMRYQPSIILGLTFLAVVVSTSRAHAQPGIVEISTPICPLLHAKAMPQGLSVSAMRFTGPSGDGRRGSAGVCGTEPRSRYGSWNSMAVCFPKGSQRIRLSSDSSVREWTCPGECSSRRDDPPRWIMGKYWLGQSGNQRQGFAARHRREVVST